MNRLMLLTLMSALSLDVGADALQKCVSASGKVEYRDYACDVGAASSQTVTVRENTSGTGTDLATIRQRDAEFRERQAAKRAAQDKIEQSRQIDAERRYREERAHRDRQEIVNAVRESNVPNYNYNYPPNQQRIEEPKVVVVPVPAAKPPSSIPAQPRKPNQ